jgi:hypothetical protein
MNTWKNLGVGTQDCKIVNSSRQRAKRHWNKGNWMNTHSMSSSEQESPAKSSPDYGNLRLDI